MMSNRCPNIIILSHTSSCDDYHNISQHPPRHSVSQYLLLLAEMTHPDTRQIWRKSQNRQSESLLFRTGKCPFSSSLANDSRTVSTVDSRIKSGGPSPDGLGNRIIGGNISCASPVMARRPCSYFFSDLNVSYPTTTE